MRAALLGLTIGLAGVSAARGAVDPQVLQAEAERVAVMAEAEKAVVAVFSPDGKGGGSGVVVSPDGYALTNFHVVAPCGPAMRCGLPDGKVYDAVIVGIDPTGDVALVKLLGREDFPAAELGDSDEVSAGDWVFAMGNPFMLAGDLKPTVTYGIVSGVHRYQYPSGTILEYTDCIQIDASINPGNSGGPLFDARGRLIGINGRASFEKRGRVNVGVAYAISINQIKNFLGYLHSGRIVDHATLGAVVGFDDDGRVIVTDILQDSDAYRRGLRYGDEIVNFGGRPILTPNGFKNVLGILPKGWRVPLSYRRDGKRVDILVRLTGVHSEGELWKRAQSRPSPPIQLPDPKKGPKGSKEDDAPPTPPTVPAVEKRPPMPEAVKAQYEAKHGYANYYFNRLQRDRVWNAWNARSGLAKPGGPWTISGPLAGGGQYRFELMDNGASLQLPGGTSKWSENEAIGTPTAPAGSGGLLTALYLWRRLAVLGPAKCGEVYYLGTAPLAGHDELTDVLVALHREAECRFYFDRTDGSLLAMELHAQENGDPCEIRFEDDREEGGRYRPHRMEVRVGDELFGVFPLEQFTVQPAAAP